MVTYGKGLKFKSYFALHHPGCIVLRDQVYIVLLLPKIIKNVSVIGNDVLCGRVCI